jgi:LCP family protein required for cell wall assembly
VNNFNNNSFKRNRISPGLGISRNFKAHNSGTYGAFPKKKKQSLLAKFNNTLNNLSTFQFFLVLLLIVIAGIWGYSQLSLEGNTNNPKPTKENDRSCTDILNPLCWSESFFPPMKQTDGYTNALLIGLDTRDDSGGLLNTDTIMVASYEHATGKTTLISFPRDLYLPYYFGTKGPYFSRINSIYAIGQNSGKDGMDLLKTNIENWLDLEIHFTAKVYFETLISAIDSVGGIEITLEKDYTDIYPKDELPDKLSTDCKLYSQDSNYCVFTFNKGVNKLDGQMSLIYARMRQLSSDFDRARRQQEIIDGLKEKAISKDGSLLDKVKFGWSIYNSLNDDKKIDSDVEFDDLMAGAFLLDKSDLNPIKIVLSPAFGDGRFLFETSIPLPGSETEIVEVVEVIEEESEPVFEENEEGELVEVTPDAPQIPTMYVVKLIGDSFEPIRNEIARIRKFSDNYTEKSSITFVNGSGVTIPPTDSVNTLKTQNPFFAPVRDASDKERFEDYRYSIFVFNKNSLKTADFLKQELGNDSRIYKVYEGGIEPQTSHKEDIKVVIANKFFNE